MSRIPPAAALPEPTPDERALSVELTTLIRAEIEHAGGSIPFARYMELALYAPGLGYYGAGKHKFGAAGDFVTAPELGGVFAQCLARQCAQILDLTAGEGRTSAGMAPGAADILEAGAGSGALAAELLLALEQLGCLPRHYFILELGTELRDRQAARLRERVPHLAARVTWLDALPDKGFRGVVLGNELLDAMPVERFRVRAQGVARLAVGWEHDSFVWREAAADAVTQQRLAPLGLVEGYESEIGLTAEGWVRSIAERLDRGALLLVDYGFPRSEFYHPQRAQGTLMCHYRHRAHTNPLILAGLQDITAHVDFSAIAEAGIGAGLELLGYATQAMFLLGCGLDEVVARGAHDARAQLTLANEVKKLTLPHEMGELFKVIALGRGIDTPLRGFRLQDRRDRL